MKAKRKSRPCPSDGAEVVTAQRDAAITQLRAVLALLDRKAYMPAPHQRILAHAEALVVESERW